MMPILLEVSIVPLVKLPIYMVACHSTCPEGYVNSNEDLTCSTCHSTCDTCSGTSATECVRCHHSKYRYVDGSAVSCVKSCPDGYY